MSHTTKTEKGSDERRMGCSDRRVNDERRSRERLSHMRGEYRSNAPRRHSDMAGRLIEGELWWSGTQRFF